MDGPPDQSQPFTIKQGVAAVLWAALCAFILYGSSGALSVDGQHGSELPGISLPDIAQNLLLYVPFGTFGIWASRRRWKQAAPLYLVLLASALVYSIAMELLQTASAARIPSPVDVASNVAGTAFGMWLAAPAERVLAALSRMMDAAGLHSTASRYALAAVLAVLVIAAWYPFDITLDVSTLSERTRPVRRDPWLRPATFELWRQALSYLVLAVVLTFSLPGLGRRAAVAAAMLTILAAMVIDLGQIGMGRYPIGVAALLSQSAGAGAGAAIAFVVTRARGNWYAAA